MKLTIIATAALIGGVVPPTLAFADQKVIQGCPQYQPEGTNAYSKVDPSCNADTTSGEDLIRSEDDKEA